VPLGTLMLNLPEASVACVKAPVPIFVARATGVPPVKVYVTTVELPPQSVTQVPDLLLEPQPARDAIRTTQNEKRGIDADIV
jgi:hypothetical protein